MYDLNNIDDIFEAGGAVALCLFAMFAVSRMLSVGPRAADDIFGQSVAVLLLAAVPSTPFGVYLALFMALVGAAISLDKLGPKPVAMVFSAGFFWTATNIVTNWFFGPL